MIIKKSAKIVKEEIDKFVAQFCENEKLDLNKIFDLSKIPEEELRNQYYDVSLVHAFSGYGSKLFKADDKTYITENDNRVTPATDVKNELNAKYGFKDWQVIIIERGHDIQICICIADFKQGADEIVNDFKQMGYFLSNTKIEVDPLNRRWRKMQFEPIYQVDESNVILNYGDLYHLTPAYNISDILSNGLQPKSDNGMFDYPDRIYMFIGNTPIQEIQNLGQQLYKTNKSSNNDGRYVLLKIDSQQLRNGYSLHYDPNYRYGVFTENGIPAKAISIYFMIKFK